MLSDRDLESALRSGELVVDPMERSQVQPASIDLRLGNEFAALPPAHDLFPSYIDPLMPPLEPMEHRTVQPNCCYPLPPHGFALACTVETVTMGNAIVGLLAGKSSLARQGLVIEAAGWIDPGFTGQLTCELFNMTDRTLMLTPGMHIAQLAVQWLSSPAERPYGTKGTGSHYQGQRGPTSSRSHEVGGKRCREPTPSSPL